MAAIRGQRLFKGGIYTKKHGMPGHLLSPIFFLMLAQNPSLKLIVSTDNMRPSQIRQKPSSVVKELKGWGSTLLAITSGILGRS